jgi:hypothetical protein
MRYGDFRTKFSQGWPRSLQPTETGWTRFRVFLKMAVMGIEVHVRLIDLKRAFRRLLSRLPDESEAGVNFIIFRAVADHLEIVSGGTLETLEASVAYPGEAQVPSSVFRGIARTLRFYHERSVIITFSLGAMVINRTAFRHPSISFLAEGIGHKLL